MLEKFSVSVFFVLISLLFGSAQACSFNCGGPYTDGNEFGLKAPSHSGFKTHEFYNMPKKAHSFSYIKSKAEARSGKAYQRFELRDGDCFPHQMEAGMIVKQIEIDLSSAANRVKSPLANNAMGIASS
jgi:hypothetical protein